MNKTTKILKSLILHLRSQGVKIDSPYDFENWIEDNASHSQMAATKLFYREDKPMARKVFVEVKVKLVLLMDEGIEVSEVLENMDYEFNSQTDGAEVDDTEIEDWEIKDSK